MKPTTQRTGSVPARVPLLGQVVIAAAATGSLVVCPAAAQAPCEQAKLVASDAQPQAYFGSSVDISGDVAVIGAYGDDHAGAETGAVYVFRRKGPNWVQEQKLTAADAFESDGSDNKSPRTERPSWSRRSGSMPSWKESDMPTWAPCMCSA